MSEDLNKIKEDFLNCSFNTDGRDRVNFKNLVKYARYRGVVESGVVKN